ncbi:MAG: 30S ribosomal protein S20 [Armatimonadaceae bacterium]
MPNIKSVKKDVIRSRQRHLRNQATKSRIKTFVKKANAAIANGDAEEIKPILFETASVVDKAAKRGIIHKNAAARRKSRLMRRAAQAMQQA